MSDKAVALKYDKEKDGAPRVIATGKGEVAQKIIQKAKDYNIPIFCNQELVASLINLELDKEIPANLYNAVVEVFVWLMKNEAKKG
jgi:flagellar biosynthesis protein